MVDVYEKENERSIAAAPHLRRCPSVLEIINVDFRDLIKCVCPDVNLANAANS